MTSHLTIRLLGQQPYADTWQAMKTFTDTRQAHTPDELWLLTHPPVYTLGQAGKPEHILDPKNIPVIQTDRGGQVTYHGPGQLVAYTLFDLRRLNLGIRQLVTQLEETMIDLLAQYDLKAHARRDAPGVYINDAKIGAIGLRVRKGCSYHGIALNINMDLTPFKHINPCGYPDLSVTQLSDMKKNCDMDAVTHAFIQHLVSKFGYSDCEQVKFRFQQSSNSE